MNHGERRLSSRGVGLRCPSAHGTVAQAAQVRCADPLRWATVPARPRRRPFRRRAKTAPSSRPQQKALGEASEGPTAIAGTVVRKFVWIFIPVITSKRLITIVKRYPSSVRRQGSEGARRSIGDGPRMRAIGSQRAVHGGRLIRAAHRRLKRARGDLSGFGASAAWCLHQPAHCARQAQAGTEPDGRRWLERVVEASQRPSLPFERAAARRRNDAARKLRHGLRGNRPRRLADLSRLAWPTLANEALEAAAVPVASTRPHPAAAPAHRRLNRGRDALWRSPEPRKRPRWPRCRRAGRPLPLGKTRQAPPRRRARRGSS